MLGDMVIVFATPGQYQTSRLLILRSVFALLVLGVFIFSMYPLQERDFYDTFKELLSDPQDKEVVELIAAAKAKKAKDPSMYDSTALEDAAAQVQIDAIAARAIIPDYMKKKKGSFRTRMERLSDLLFLCYCYYGGEHYHTPSPFRKICLDRKLKQWIVRWDQAVRRKFSAIEENAVKILYPLQMQPEANLDIWGNPYRDQAALISEILAHTPEDVLLVVKANPKTKYEFTDELLKLVETQKRIIPVPRDTSMGAVLPKVQLIITVTGTIAIECILSGKPVLTLIKTLNNTVSACPYLEHLSQLPNYLNQIREGTFPLASLREKIDFFNLLNRTSYPGYPYENILRDPEGQAKVLAAFRSLVNPL